MKLMSILTACAVTLAVSSTPALARTVNKKSKNVRQASYDRSADYSSYSTSMENRGSSPGTVPEIKLGLGSVTGFNDLVQDGEATLMSADMQFRLDRNLFVPIGVSRWKGELSDQVTDGIFTGTATMSLVDFGLGYRAWLSPKTYIPIGARFGWYELEVEVEFLGESFSVQDYGRCASLFTGFAHNISRRVALGYDGRFLRCATSDKVASEEDDESDDKGDGDDGLSYHSFAVTFAL